MAKLFALPPEILIGIIELYILPDDLVNFCLASRRLHDLGYSRLCSHKALVTQWGKITLREWPEDARSATTSFKARSPYCIIHAIQQDPWIAYYVRSLVSDRGLNRSTTPHCLRDGAPSEAIQQHYQACDLAKILENWSWHGTDKRHQWQAELEAGNETTALVVLLTMLPNLNALQIRGKMLFGELLSQALPSLPDLLQPVRVPECSFGKLSTLQIQTFDNGHQNTLHDIASLVLLPSLKSFHGHNIRPTRLRNSSIRLSRVEYVVLSSSNISAEDLAMFVRPMTKLKVFKYEPGPVIGVQFFLHSRDVYKSQPKTYDFDNPFKKRFISHARDWLVRNELYVRTSYSCIGESDHHVFKIFRAEDMDEQDDAEQP